MKLVTILTCACLCLLQCNDAAGACEEAESKLSADKQKSVVDLHNKYRSEEGGTTMYSLQWDDSLAKRAQALADTCKFEHGFTTKCDGSGKMGQNLAIKAPVSDVSEVSATSSVDSWFNEKEDYTFADGSCAAGKACGHYTQVVWGNTRKVGCGVAYCPVATFADGSTWNNAGITVCNYDPPGNYVGQKPYEKGTPCSGCSTDTPLAGYGYEYKCETNMCTPCQNSGTYPNCDCQLKDKCKNGGTFVEASCSCSCTEKYGGALCEKFTACEDASPYCNQWEQYCKQAAYRAFIEPKCKKTCEFC